MSKKYKTQGLDWLLLSLASFNGSGYANKFSAHEYLDSYEIFKTLKNDTKALELLRIYRVEAYERAFDLLEARDANRTPNQKMLNKMQSYREQRLKQSTLL